MNDVRDLDTRLNDMIRNGKILEALDQFFADDASFQEGNAPARIGKKNDHDYLAAFFETLKQFEGATLHASAVNGDVSLSEWTFAMIGKDGPIRWNEVIRRHWRNGKVVSERYYLAPSA